MKLPIRRTLAGMAVLAAASASLPGAALAGHGKAGLWNVTVTMDNGAAMPRLTPEQMAKMRAAGMQMPDLGRTMTHQHCMTAAEVAADTIPPMGRNGECKPQNVKASGNGFSADVACSGEMQGTGHMSMTFASAEHYSGRMTFSGVTHGHPANMTTSFEGRWISASCPAGVH
jgi:hypothetical protein